MKSSDAGLGVEISADYDELVSAIHKQCVAEREGYDPDKHMPLLLQISLKQ
jgi:hypothetical protein